MTTNRIDDWALHAYVDNEVSDQQRAEIEAVIAANPDIARKVEDWRRQRSLLKQAFDPALDEPLPASLKATLRSGGSFAARPYLAMAAALALLLLGGLAGWSLRQETSSALVADIANDALAAHEVYSVEVRHPVEVEAGDEAHLQAWLSKRLGTPFRVPDLTAEGYALLGGRLLASNHGPAAMLMYEDHARNRVSVYLTSQQVDQETSLHVEQKGKLIACYWRAGKLAFAVAGEMERDPMMKLAEAVYEAFES
jgi:anti-sigma factor RsiW